MKLINFRCFCQIKKKVRYQNKKKKGDKLFTCKWVRCIYDFVKTEVY